MLLVRILFIDTSLSKLVDGFTELSNRLRTSEVYAWGMIRPKSITILYCDFTLFIDIFHFKVLFLCCFAQFTTFRCRSSRTRIQR